MAFTPSVECPIWQETLELDRTLEDHLVKSHTQREVARYIASLRNQVERHLVAD